MTKKEKFEAITNAYELKHRDIDDKDIQIIKKNIPEEVHDALLDIQRNLEVGFEISYDIVSDACDIIHDRLTPDEAEKEDEDIISTSDLLDHNGIETASCYTSEQLRYISSTNQHEISDIIKECELDDIASAAAIWYDRKVEEACIALIDYINE